MHLGRTTLSKFLIEKLRGKPHDGDLGALLVDVAAAVKAIAAMTAKGALGNFPHHESHTEPLDESRIVSNILLRSCEWAGLVAGMASAIDDRPYDIPQQYRRGKLLLLFNPLEGGENADVNVPVGSTFSVFLHEENSVPTSTDYLQAGTKLLAAGYAMYGTATMLVLSVGSGTHAFTLDREIGNFILTHPNLSIAADTADFAINSSNERFWEPPVQRYVSECKAGKAGERGGDFTMRWIASMVADVHRILMRGGVFLLPRDHKVAGQNVRCQLLFDAQPLSFLIEQAGGAASTGRARLLEITPDTLHQMSPVIMGSVNEVRRIERYHKEYDEGTDRAYVSPLFNQRSLYRDEFTADTRLP